MAAMVWAGPGQIQEPGVHQDLLAPSFAAFLGAVEGLDWKQSKQNSADTPVQDVVSDLRSAFSFFKMCLIELALWYSN